MTLYDLPCFPCFSALVLLCLTFHCFFVNPLSFLAFAAGVVLGLFFLGFQPSSLQNPSLAITILLDIRRVLRLTPPEKDN